AIRVAQDPPHLDHTGERALLVGKLRHAKADRPVAGEARRHTHGPEIAQVPRNGGGQDGDDAETLAKRESGQHAAFGNAEHGPAALFAQRVEARITETGDDEGARAVCAGRRPAEQRSDDAVDVALGLDAGGPLGQGQAGDGRPVRAAQGLHRGIDPLRDRDAGIGIDDVDGSVPFAHGFFSGCAGARASRSAIVLRGSRKRSRVVTYQSAPCSRPTRSSASTSTWPRSSTRPSRIHRWTISPTTSVRWRVPSPRHTRSRHSSCTGEAASRGAATAREGSVSSPATASSSTSGGKSMAQTVIAGTSARSTRLTTMLPVSRMLRSVSLSGTGPSRPSMPRTTSGGAWLKTLKKLNGAALARPCLSQLV